MKRHTSIAVLALTASGYSARYASGAGTVRHRADSRHRQRAH